MLLSVPDRVPMIAHMKPGYAIFAGGAAIVTVSILIVAKTIAWLMTGSSSVLASLTDSVIDAGVSVMNFLAIRYSLKPADEEHRYGHGKVEGVAALFQSAFIAGAALFLFLEGVSNLLKAVQITDHMVAVGVMVFSIVLSLILVAIQKFCLRHAPSLAVEADSAHYSSDILINGGTIAAILVIYAGGPWWIDPLFALAVAFWLVRTAWIVAGKGMDMLMDRELPDGDREKILGIINGHKNILGVHDLRTRKIGMSLHISFDVEQDPGLTLKQAHAASKDVEAALLKEFPNAEIMIHQDPAGEPEDSRHPDKERAHRA